MIRKRNGLPRYLPSLAVALAAFVIGCGGGGGGGTSKSGNAIGGNSSGGGVVDGTTGTVTTGGTTGASVTTGSGSGAEDTTGGGAIDPTTGGGAVDPTTGSTTGTIDPTTGGSTTGTTTTGGTTDPTTGGSTTGSSTTGGTTDPTTGGSTTGGSTTGSSTTGGTTDPTTGGSTTGTSATDGSNPAPDTTGGSTSGSSTTGGSSGNGASALRANAIYFGHFGDPSVVSSVLPDGSGRVDEGGGASVAAVIADPTHAGGFVYAAMVNGFYGVYRGTSFDPASSTTLANPAYDYVSALQASANGAILMVATRSGTPTAYLLQNGSVTKIDAADDAAISVDGSLVAYTRSGVGVSVWSRASGTSFSLDTGSALLPSFSKDGGWILFSSDRDRSYDLYQVPASGGTVERITNTPDIDELGGCYNEGRTMVSYVSYSADPAKMGVFVLSNLGTRRVAADSDLGLATYWTDSIGRSRTLRRGARFQRLPSSVRTHLKKARRK